MTNGFVNSTFGKICVEMAIYLNRVVIPKRNFIGDRNDTVMIDVVTILKDNRSRRSEFIWSKAIGFSDFGWSNRADNMQQDLTLAQCKSKFRIFQVGIQIKESLRIDKILMIKLSRDP